jgi:type I restriction enzyme S subunit
MVKRKKNIPALRFPGFEGEWEEKKLGMIAEKINSGKTPLGGESVYTETGVLFIRSQNVTDNKLSNENITYIPDTINNTMQNSIVKPKDILLNITGASLGRSCVVPKDFVIGNVNQHVCIIRIDKNNEPYFIQPIFASEKGQNLLNSLQTGSGREGLNFQSIRLISFSFPSLPEQQKTAAFLTAVDERIQHLTRKKNLLEQYKKGVMQKIFSRKIRFKDEKGKGFPDWEEKTLGELSDLITKGTTPSKFVNEGIKFIKIECFDGDQINQEKCLFIDEHTHNKELKRSILKEGDILFAIAGSIGKCNIVTVEVLPANTNQALAIVRPKKDENINFMYHILKSYKMQKYIFDNISVGAQPNLNLEQMNNFSFFYPSPPEQNHIATFLTTIDKKIEQVNTQLQKTQAWKKGLLQKMFV